MAASFSLSGIAADRAPALATINMGGKAARIVHFIDSDPAWSLVTAFIHERFEKSYNADLQSFMRQYFVLQDADGEILAAAGLQGAQGSELYLEKYLDLPLERLSSAALRRELHRSQIVEIGNLAAGSRGAGKFLILALTDLLYQAGYHYVTFTGTAKLGKIFSRMNIEIVPLGPADGERLGSDKAQWGNYYESDPVVFVGCIASGREIAMNTGLLRGLGYECFLQEQKHA